MGFFTQLLNRFFGQDSQQSTVDKARPISRDLRYNHDTLADAFADCSDFVVRHLELGREKQPCLVLFIKGITDNALVHQAIIEPLQGLEVVPCSMIRLEEQTLHAGETRRVECLDDVAREILHGNVAVLMDGLTEALIIGASKFNLRAIEEPAAERTVVGPKEGFIENLAENLALMRRHLPIPQFKSKLMKIGRQAKTQIAVCYIEGVVDQELLDEVTERLQNTVTQSLPTVYTASYLIEVLEDHPQSPFPQVIDTGRPDKVSGNLLEGRVAIIVDNSPTILIVPAAMPDFFQSPEDYYLRPIASFVARVIRLISIGVATTATPLYVAVMTFHYEVIPARLLIPIAENRSRVPFTALLEALVMEGAFELLREATTRLPTVVGQTIGVVGALILGQAAIQAGLVSPLLVIVIALSAIASFAIPNNHQATAIRLMRFPLTLAAGVFGGFGIVFVWVVILTHWASMDSFGTPYMRPVVPLRLSALRDFLIRPLKRI